MDVYEAAARVKAGAVLPVYVLAGNSAFLRAEMTAFLRDQLLDPAFVTTDYQVYDTDDPGAIELALQGAYAPTFSGGRRMVVLKGNGAFGGKPADGRVTEAVVGYLDNPSDCAVVVFNSKSCDTRRKTSTLARKLGYLVKCDAPTGKYLIEWVLKRIRLAGKRSTAAAARRLVEICGEDLGVLSGEIDKLVCYVGEEGDIAADDVELLASPMSENKAFALVDAIVDGQPGKAFALVESLVRQGEVPLAMMALMSGQIRTLAACKSMLAEGRSPDEIARGLKVHPYVVRKSMDKARTVSERWLSEVVRRLHEADWAIKSGQQDQRLALELLAYRLAKTAKGKL